MGATVKCWNYKDNAVFSCMLMLAVPNIILQQCSDQIQSKQLRCVHMKHSNKNSASHSALIPLAPWAPSPNQEPRHAKQEFESNMFSFRMGFWEFRHLIMRLWTSSMTVHPRFNSVLFNKVLPTTRRQKKTSTHHVLKQCFHFSVQASWPGRGAN